MKLTMMIVLTIIILLVTITLSVMIVHVFYQRKSMEKLQNVLRMISLKNYTKLNRAIRKKS